MPTDRNLGTRIARDLRDELRLAHDKRAASRTPPLMVEGRDFRSSNNSSLVRKLREMGVKQRRLRLDV